MRNTRWELNPYSFYDTEGLARHFERMAAEGWAPDRVGFFIRCAEHMAGPPAKAAALALGSVSPEGQITNAR